MPRMVENFLDSIVTDPPYELTSSKNSTKGFMGKEWDGSGIAYNIDVWSECLRVLKPGGYLLAFGGTRTSHRMVCAIEDAGFEIRDSIMWLYGCLSEDTEILTKYGWERFHISKLSSIFVSKEILIYDSETDTYKWELPSKWQHYNVKDTAYRIQSDNTDQIVSRNHRCLVERGGRLVFRKAEALQHKESVPVLESLPIVQSTLSSAVKGTGSAKQYCSQECVSKIIGEANSGKKQKQQKCSICDNLFYPTWQSKKKPRVYCSTVCSGKSKDWIKIYAGNGKGKKNPLKGLKMEKNPAWNGGLTYMRRKGKYANQSIKYVRCPKEFIQMSRKDGYVMEHRLMVAREIGRPLLRTECVHHINHDAEDNRTKNLMLFRCNADHKRHEHGQPITPLWQPLSLSNTQV